MDTNSPQSPALSHYKFYILLALSREELHRYDLHSVAMNCSLGTVRMGLGRSYSCIKELQLEKLVEEAGVQEVGKHGKPRMLYRIAPEGRVRLKDDLKRMKHAITIGERAGLFFEDLPADIQRMINAMR